MSGRLGIDDVSVGTLATAGSTPLATIGVVDPVFVQFAVSEQDICDFRGKKKTRTHILKSV